MKTFKDAADREWCISINVGVVKRVKAQADFDLLGVVGGETSIERLASDPILLSTVLYSLVSEQAIKAGISQEQFDEGLRGDCIDQATTAFLEELASFFPSPRRAVLLKSIAKAREVEQAMLESVNKKLDSPELAEKIRQAMDGAGTSTPVPPSSA